MIEILKPNVGTAAGSQQSLTAQLDLIKPLPVKSKAIFGKIGKPGVSWEATRDKCG